MTEQDIDAILADFRSWLLQANTAAAEADSTAEPAAPEVDLHTLISQFVALRHEVNLQTRAVRGQQEQNAETLRQLSDAVATLQDREAGQQQDTEQVQTELLRPFLKTLVDVHDALSLARREAQRVKENVLPALDQIVTLARHLPTSQAESTEAVVVRFLGAGKALRRFPPGHGKAEPEDTLQPEQAEKAVERIRRLVDSLVDGYAMSLQRLERALDQAGLEAIPALGTAFDPETMEVVEVVHEAGRVGTEVLEEVRRGYYWQGRVFRFAQVRVARPAP
jgi:molecular chaperone GrpE